MQWLELTIKIASAGIDLVAAKLTMLGFDSFIIDDQADFQEFLEQNTQYWDYVDSALEKKMEGLSQIRLYIEDDMSAPETVAALRQQLQLWRAQSPELDLGELSITLANLKEEDWENNWKQYYQPLPIGRRLLVVPLWLQPENPDGRIPICLDPGMIFGTGAHATTQMCLLALEDCVCGGERVIDLGSGSGILSIAALLLGASTATGVDIDPAAEKISRENAALNALGGDRFTAVTSNVLEDRDAMLALSHGGYDIVLANIVADVIIPLSSIVPAFLRPGGKWICSGILDTRLPEVEQALKKNGLSITGRNQIGDWCQLTAGFAE